MRRHRRNRSTGFVLLAALWLGGVQTPVGAADKEKNAQQELPKWSSLEQVVSRQLQSQPDYKKGDLITQSEIKPVFEQFRQLGWIVPDRRSILRSVPADNEFIATSLSTKSGKKFMRRIASYPEAYDRLYRLAALSGGRKIVADLVRGPGGYEMIEYLTTSQGGKNMGKMLDRTPKGHNFNKPTGKLFTEKLFIERVKQSYDRDQESRRQAAKK